MEGGKEKRTEEKSKEEKGRKSNKVVLRKLIF
jgi:hypothetical protein